MSQQQGFNPPQFPQQGQPQQPWQPPHQGFNPPQGQPQQPQQQGFQPPPQAPAQHSLKAPVQPPRALPRPGMDVGRCYSIIDLGTQETAFKGNVKYQRKVIFQFELPNQTHVFDEEKGPQPHSITQRFTLSLSVNSNLRKFLSQWFPNYQWTDENCKNLDMSKLISQPAMLNIAHKEHEGNNYANIVSINPLPQGHPAPPQVNPSVFYVITMGRNNVFKSLHEKVQRTISSCMEWNSQEQSYSQPDAPDGPPQNAPQSGNPF